MHHYRAIQRKKGGQHRYEGVPQVKISRGCWHIAHAFSDDLGVAAAPHRVQVHPRQHRSDVRRRIVGSLDAMPVNIDPGKRLLDEVFRALSLPAEQPCGP